MIDLSYLFILLIHNIHFIHFSMIDLYPNLIITDFHYDFFMIILLPYYLPQYD